MHIVLDLQACQSPESRRRGIGRYSLALAKAMAEQSRGHKITVFLNAAMGESIEFLRAQFDGLLPQQRLITWEALAPTDYIHPENAFRMRASEVLRMQALRQLKPDVVHVASLFEGLADEVIATVPEGEDHPSAVTLYDLIPLAHEQTYLTDPRIRRWYMEKIAHLRRAEVLLGISRFTCEEAAELLQIPQQQLVNISGAADSIFTRLDDAETFRLELMHRYRLQRSFIMYAGGFDARKNIDALIRAFAWLPVALRRAHQLVIVGGAPPRERAALTTLAGELGLAADEVVFAGYVPDSDLVKLYNLCALYVFPSLQEGFGLPALEAMASGAVVIGSNTSSLPEVIGRADALFDPRSESAIAAKMVSALTDNDFRASLREHAQGQCRKFSWQESAGRAIDAFEAVVARRKRTNPVAVAASLAPEQGTTAFLPAPHSAATQLLTSPVVTYADGDCAGVSASSSLARFVHDRGSGRFDRVVLELADDAYCAKTLAFAATGAVDILLRDRTFGAALRALAQSDKGRAMVVSLLYSAGGYPALRSAIDDRFSERVLAELVNPRSLLSLGRSQVMFAEALAVGAHDSLAWRENMNGAIREIVAAEGAATATKQDWSRTAAALSTNMTVPDVAAQWLVDISNLAIHDAGTGIQRVVRQVLDELLLAPPPGYRVEPVCLGDDGVFRYARSYCQRRYFQDELLPPDEPVEFARGDVYLGLDLVAHLIPAHAQLFRQMRNRGVRQHFVLYDLLPILRPDCFAPHLLPIFRSWYEAIAEVADSVICISRAVADEFESWLHQFRPERQRPLGIGWFHLGADLAPAEMIQGAEPVDAGLAGLGERPTFLMVGTIEPRKGHAQTLAAFEQLWLQGMEVNLLVLGKPGWLVDDLLQRMAEHPQRGKRLFWFEQAADDMLLAAYHRASALIMASEGEGFGLPLIEAAHHGVPLIARDLPVFREIAGDHALYFSGFDAEDLGSALRAWLELDADGQAPQPAGMRWNTWSEATGQLIEAVNQESWIHRWMPAPIRRYGAFDHRFQTEVGRLVRGRMLTSGKAGLFLRGPGVPLGAGRYTVRVQGSGSGALSIQVSSSAGTKVHVRRDVVSPGSPSGTLLSQFELSLEHDVADIELCIQVDADAELSLAGIEVCPVDLAAISTDRDEPAHVVVAMRHGGDD